MKRSTLVFNIEIQFHRINIEDVFSPAETMNQRKWNELKIQMRNLDLDKHFIRCYQDPNLG